ncbi:MAG: AEC family transporter [Bdellovibrionales bacterium]
MNSNLVLIFSALLSGMALRRVPQFPGNAHQALNAYVIWISLPALVLTQIPQLLSTTPLSHEYFVPVSMAWILFLLSCTFFYFLGHRLRWNKAQTGALMLTAGLGNTSFVGLPILESLLGKEALPIGILVDQPGTFLVLSTLGILVASALSPLSKGPVTAKSIAKKVLTFPPFISLALAFVLYYLEVPYSDSVQYVLERLASTLVPLALVAVGFQLRFSRQVFGAKWRPLALGLGFKLVLAPLFFVALYIWLLASTGFITRVTILESAMAPMITASVVAEEFGFDSELTSLMLGLGIPLSIFTVSLWNQLLVF